MSISLAVNSVVCLCCFVSYGSKEVGGVSLLAVAGPSQKPLLLSLVRSFTQADLAARLTNWMKRRSWRRCVDDFIFSSQPSRPPSVRQVCQTVSTLFRPPSNVLGVMCSPARSSLLTYKMCLLSVSVSAHTMYNTCMYLRLRLHLQWMPLCSTCSRATRPHNLQICQSTSRKTCIHDVRVDILYVCFILVVICINFELDFPSYIMFCQLLGTRWTYRCACSTLTWSPSDCVTVFGLWLECEYYCTYYYYHCTNVWCLCVYHFFFPSPMC